MGTNHASNQWLTYSGQAANDWSGGIDFFSNGDIATAYSVARSNGASTVVVQRLSKDGVVLWSKEINADYAPGVGSVLVGNDNSIYIVGGTKTGISGESGKNDSDVFAAALSGTGQTLWYRNYGIGIHEIGASAVLDGNGNIILNGRVSEVNDAYTFIKDVPNFYGAEFSSGWRGFQLKINPIDGEVIKAYTTGSFNSGGELIAVDQLRNTVFVGGYTFGAVNGVQTIGNGDPAGANKYLIARNETNGTVLWTRMENWIRSNIVAQSSEDAIYFVDKGVVEKVKGSTGQTIWSKSIANTDYVLSPISGGGILISESNSNGTLAIRRWDGDGNEIKTQIITHTGTLSPRSFVEMGDGNLIISGTVSGEVSLTDNIVKIINNGGGSEGFVMQVKSAFSEYPPSTNNNYITPFGNALYFVSYENAVSIDSAQKVNSPYTGREEYGFAYASIIGSEATVTGEGGWSRRKLIQTLDVSESVSSGLIYLDFKPISANGKPNARIRFNYKVVGDSSEGKHVITEGTIDSVVGLNGDHHMWWHGHWTSTENDIKIESSYDLTHITNLQLEIQFYNVTAEGSEYFTFDTGFRVRSGNFEWDASSLSNSFSDNLPMSSSPIIRGNSLYTIVDGPSWTEAEANSVKLGGHLVTINDASENLWIVDYYRQTGISLSPDSRGVRNIFIGLTRNEGTGTKYGNPAGKWDGWISGESSSYRPEYWGIGEGMDPDGYFSALVWGEGTWNDFPEWQHQGVGLAEIPFIRRGDSAYVIVQGPTWEEAEANANKLGGHLVTINDAEEEQFLLNNTPGGWIGYTDKLVEGQWEWIDGSPKTYERWDANNPSNNWGLENYAYLDKGAYFGWGAGWNDIPNDYWNYIPQGDNPRMGGIAELKLAPNNTPTGTPTLSGNLKVGSTISIDASGIQDADNHEYWTPVYQYYWEIANDPAPSFGLPQWQKLTTSDATDGDEILEITDDLEGKFIRGVVSFLDGYGTNEIVNGLASIAITTDGAPFQSLAFASIPYFNIRQGIEVNTEIAYDISNQDVALTGIAVNLFFDSSQIDVLTDGNLFQKGLLGSQVVADTSDADGNSATDSVLSISYADFNGEFPGDGIDLPLLLANLKIIATDAYTGTSLFLAGVPATGYGIQGSQLDLGFNAAPVMSNTVSNQVMNRGDAFSYSLPGNLFTDEDSEITINAQLASGENLPEWLSFDPTAGSFTGTSTSGGSYDIKVSASDELGSVSTSFTLTIREVQSLSSTESPIRFQRGQDITVPVNYSTTDGSQTPGLSFRVHYDSSLFSFDPSTGISNQAQADLFQIGTVQQDTEDFDGDASTDRYIPINIASFSGIFPTGGQPTKLVDLTFKAADLPYDSITGLRTTTINFSEQEAAQGYGFDSTSATLIPLAFNLDVDGDGKVTALGDGLMIIRKMFGSAFAGDALTNKAISPNATRTSAEIHQYIENGINNGFLDVDKDGKTTALGDGLMVIRHLFGPAFAGDALISKAISPDSPYFGNSDASSFVADNIDALRPLIA